MRYLFPLILLAGAGLGIAAVARADGKKKAVRDATLDPILSDEEADEVLSDAGDDVIGSQINSCSNGIGQTFTFQDIGAFANAFGYDIYWSDVALTTQEPKQAYQLNDKSRAFDATVCMFMYWSVENRWIPDQVTNAELAGWRANQDLSQLGPPPFFPQF